MIFNTIITVSDLAEHIHSPNWLILDCRSGGLNDKKSYKKYADSHIPNAFYCIFTENFQSDFEKNSPCSSFTAAKSSEIMNCLKENGFDNTSQIIIYDDKDSTMADSMWLILRSLGCQSVAVLQGGFSSWVEHKFPLDVCEKMKGKGIGV